jgi:ATP-dependent DNA helicase HFM1/MER3
MPPIVNNTRLIDPRQSLPDKFRAVFPFQLFNAVQSKCFPLVYGTNDNVVISAPTGSGKTAVLELAICKLMSDQGGGNFKIVYKAPTKSLCSEKARDWQTKFSHVNLQCVELTGDTSQTETHRVGNASIIVTTPEKWDSITRKWKDHRKLLDLVRLVLIDEVHILKDTRGATLEAVVSRMKTIGANIRFVAISATVPNIDDVAKWLGRDHQNQHEPARFEVFGEELRPVKLQRFVYGYEGAPNNDFGFEKALDRKLTLLLAKHSTKKPIMIFCFTRKSCERTARILAEWWSASQAKDRAWPPPTNRIRMASQDLQEIVRYGVAFHHAGLDFQTRASIEENFLNGQLHVICCTSTLAVGVNLPCHTVVLKGTTHYTDDGPQEYSDLEVMQMLGRAGRPQFDSSAVAVIMTRLANVQRYEKLVSGEELLESTLHRNLLEHLNSEIGLGTIQDTQTAKKWIGGTFLSVRVRQSPSLYNLENVQDAAGADEQMEEWCERDVRLLQEYGLVSRYTPLVCTEYGQAMSRYMVQFETMKLLLSIPRAASLEEMVSEMSKLIESLHADIPVARRRM